MYGFRGMLLVPFLASTTLLMGQQALPVPTIRAQSELVVVDVTVTDAHGSPIHGLTQSDFTVSEDGRPQAIKDFEAHTANAAPAQPAPLPKLPPGTFTNQPTAPDNGALNVLVLDKLNTPLKDQGYVLQQFKDYLKSMPAGTRVAVFGLTTQLKMLQGFTSGPAVLRGFLEGKKGLPGASVAMNDAVSGDAPGSMPITDSLTEMVGSDPDAATMLANVQQFEAEQQSFMLQLRARYTLDAFNLLGRYLENLPGRKNVLWFSGSFPISILPDGDLANPFAVVADSEQEFRETTDLLARSQVAVYPIDARGLMINPTLSVTNSGSKYVKNPGAASKDEAKFFQQTAQEHATMQQMAEATGGKAYVNTNGLKEAAANAIETGTNYYTITYVPTNNKRNGEYRKIQVKLDKPQATLAYRQGYYADDTSSSHHNQAAAPPAPSSSPAFEPVRIAMIHGAPSPAQVIFDAAARPVAGGLEAAVADGNKVNPKIKGPFQRYLIHYSLSPREVSCPANANNLHECHVEFVANVFDADGVLQNYQDNGINAALDEARYARFLNSRLAYNQVISVPAKGNYYIRAGVHDATTGRVGALEFPVAAVAKLPPVEAQTRPAEKH
jgi:VWFA-related protein